MRYGPSTPMGAKLFGVLNAVNRGEHPMQRKLYHEHQGSPRPDAPPQFCVMVTTDHVVTPDEASRVRNARGKIVASSIQYDEATFTDFIFDVADKETAKELAHVVWGKGLPFVNAVRVGIHGQGSCPDFLREEEGCIFERQ